jgi:hypothetical protein
MVGLVAGNLLALLGAAGGCGGASDGPSLHDGGDAGDAGEGPDAAVACFPCMSYWTCGADVGRVTLEPTADGCHLSGLTGEYLLAPDGTITEAGVVVGTAIGTGARVQVNRPDGSQWLFCAGGSECPMSLGP